MLWWILVLMLMGSGGPSPAQGAPVQRTVALVTPLVPGDGYPDASTTGVPVGTTLTVLTGNQTVTTAGAILDSVEIHGCVVVQAPNVIIRKSKILCNDMSGIFNESTNLLVEDTEVDCGNAAGRTGITPVNYTARRVNVHHCENVLWAETNVLIEESYLHDPINYSIVTDPHTDSVQVPGSAVNITIRRNRIYGNFVDAENFGNSAITTGGTITNLLIEDNLLAGGGYTMRCEGEGSNTAYRVMNNRFSTLFTPNVGGYGPVQLCSTRATLYCGNVLHETGVLLGDNAVCP